MPLAQILQTVNIAPESQHLYYNSYGLTTFALPQIVPAISLQTVNIAWNSRPPFDPNSDLAKELVCMHTIISQKYIIYTWTLPL